MGVLRHQWVSENRPAFRNSGNHSKRSSVSLLGDMYISNNNKNICWKKKEFPDGSGGLGSGAITAVALVTALARIRSLAWELLHAQGEAKKKKKPKHKNICHSFSHFVNLDFLAQD